MVFESVYDPPLSPMNLPYALFQYQVLVEMALRPSSSSSPIPLRAVMPNAKFLMELFDGTCHFQHVARGGIRHFVLVGS